MHAALAPELAAQRVDLLFGAGPLTRALYRCGAGGDARRLGRAVERHSRRLVDALRGGDVVMVKGSNGSRMGPLVAALARTFLSAEARR